MKTCKFIFAGLLVAALSVVSVAVSAQENGNRFQTGSQQPRRQGKNPAKTEHRKPTPGRAVCGKPRSSAPRRKKPKRSAACRQPAYSRKAVWPAYSRQPRFLRSRPQSVRQPRGIKPAGARRHPGQPVPAHRLHFPSKSLPEAKTLPLPFCPKPAYP